MKYANHPGPKRQKILLIWCMFKTIGCVKYWVWGWQTIELTALSTLQRSKQPGGSTQKSIRSCLLDAASFFHILYLCPELLFLFGHISSQPVPGSGHFPAMVPARPSPSRHSLTLQGPPDWGVAFRLLNHLLSSVPVPVFALVPGWFPAPWLSSASFPSCCLNSIYLHL